MKTIHLIFNAHLDPIWLWPWQAGLDAVLATCRSACDRLDNHPDLVFTRGEAWAYQQIEKVDPALFARIRQHIRAGRWSLVGGWWIQPDCNLPSGFAMRKQIELGRQYFTERFGSFPRVAYNVDSFGHAAGLPGLMREAGQDCYVMMRPQEHEMKLPARLFRWRGFEGGPEVVTFRIARAYTTWQAEAREHIKASLSELPEGIDHTMCFLGVGDHGGGPTEEQIAWVKENGNSFEGCKLEFSSPQRFFEAIMPQVDRLPLVTGELQYHAIGCYAVHRPVKVGVRKSEHRLRQAEIALQCDAQPDPQSQADIRSAWRRVVFHHFHDTLGGTCIPSAYEQVDAQLGHSRFVADEILQHSLRRQLACLPDDPLQRVVLFNASDRPFDGYTTIEPWMGWRGWQPHFRVIDEQGSVVPQQAITPEPVVNGLVRLTVRIQADPGQMRVLRIDEAGRAAASARKPDVLQISADGADAGHAAIMPAQRTMRLGRHTLPLPRLDVLEDLTDTWSHGVDRYPEVPQTTAGWNPATLVESGPVMASFVLTGLFGQSWALAEYRLFAGEPFVELRLRIHWSEQNKVLKLVLPFSRAIARRRDGVMDCAVDRLLDGAERPMRDWTLLSDDAGPHIGVVTPDVFALDATPHRVRFTLLRSPRMAHHDPCRRSDPRDRFADQGEHDFRFRFYAAADLTDQYLNDQALMLHRPLVTADLTRGMGR